MPVIYPKLRKRHIVDGPNRTIPHWNISDKTGIVFGELIVIGDSGKRNRSRGVLWECRCSCGRTLLRDGSTLIAGKSSSCGHTRFTPEIIRKMTAKSTRPKAALKRSYRQYHYAAISRGYVFALSLDEFESIVNKVCFYCGSPPSMLKKARSESRLLNGVDRVDNTKGYYFDNCVPCCTMCNRMKLELSQDEFLDHIARISHYQQEK